MNKPTTKDVVLHKPSPESIIKEVLAERHRATAFCLKALESFEGHGYTLGEAMPYITEARKNLK